ncbi:MAG: SpoIID/LytB domain-containing protein [Proteobacteria bacterium]|nr:SpoIID/LytB domain-containing protein [Cystobacterineae bacterium]MCL2259391.1 SpoIID/LytB domain-containing protein [Cystobacterineae bacterium]MCL2314188.1 SpoIID/LytB domain-containing protein [Pseudomonadota bacterium]
MRRIPQLLLCLSLCALHARAEETVRIVVQEKVWSLALGGEKLWFSTTVGEEPLWQELPGEVVHIAWKQGKLWLNSKPTGASIVLFGAGKKGQIGTHPLRLGQLALRGQLELHAGKQGLSAINILPLEDYLMGVLGREMPKSFPMEALKAQAVAARTYALQKKLQRLDEKQHLGASVLHQVYGGLAAEDARTHEAVTQTRGQVLLFGVEPVEAYFHASCGGLTETGKEALTRDLPYLRAQKCPCRNTKAARWQTHLSEAELKKLFGVANPQLAQGLLTSTGRYKTLLVGGQSFAAAEFRRRLGTTRLRSLKFRIRKEKGGYLLEGEGYGHGAGMCQWGAKHLAEDGKTYIEILYHYYAGSRLMVLY